MGNKQRKPTSTESSKVRDAHVHRAHAATFDVLADANARPHVEGIEGAVAACRQGGAPGCLACQRDGRTQAFGTSWCGAADGAMGGCGATQHEARPSQDERSLSSLSACLSRLRPSCGDACRAHAQNMRPHNRPVLAFSRDLLRARARARATCSGLGLGLGRDRAAALEG